MGRVHPQVVRTMVPAVEPVLKMQRTADCEVTVVDDVGQPIADATVSLWPNQIWFHRGSNILGTGHDSLKALQIEMQTGEAPKWQLGDKRFEAKTNARGMALIKNLPVSDSDPARATKCDFYVVHDKYEVPVPPKANRGREQTVELLPAQTGRVTVRMKATPPANAAGAEPRK